MSAISSISRSTLPRTAATALDPADHADFTEVSEFVYGGPPRGQ